MKLSYNWLQSFFKEKLPEPKKMADLFNIRFFEVEEIDKKNNDQVLDISILPSRAGDCLSHLGVAREISAITGIKIKEPVPKLKEGPANKEISLDVRNDCLRYTARVIKNVKVGPTPKWIRERIESCGLQSINNIVDIANYVMLETGQPLHVFDLDKVSNKIIVRKSKKGESITTLDNKKYELDKDILVIADDNNILAIAGIKGGKTAEVDENTKNILLESANFNRLIVRRGSAKLKLRTDASVRFENGMDPNLTEIAATRAIGLIQEIAGGDAAKGLIDFYPEKIKPKTIKLNLDKTESLLGIMIPKSQIKKILKSLFFEIKKETDQIIEVEVPTRRVDVSIQEDLIEEIGRLYGYENIQIKFPSLEIVSPKRNMSLFWEDNIKNNLRSIGFSEIYNYSCISEEQFNNFGYSKDNITEVESPVSLEQKYLRPELTPHIIKNIKDNEKHFDDIKIFELGNVFITKNEKVDERKVLTGAITEGSFLDAKGIVEFILEEMGIENIDYQNNIDSIYLHLMKKSSVIINGNELGFLGEVSPAFLKDLKINSSVTVFSLDFDKIKMLATEDKYYKQITKFPEVTRDLSILVPQKTEYQEVINLINSLKLDFLRDVRLFDIYEGKEIPSGKKNMALRLTFQANRTLTAEEINSFQDRIIKNIESNNNWEIRK
ncbi:MAG: phenylalanine--tRNA ligase subunit beta [Candidatus Nealsonbacteria bacterium]|nr:phenylalanine--tRNA ligase subunit beta [Candidatus Nealsonbacteria bacterium]